MKAVIPAIAGIPKPFARAALSRKAADFRRWTAALFAAALLLSCMALTMAWAQVPVPPLKAPVTDLTGTLSAQQVADLDARLRAWSQNKGSQIAVLMVPTTKPEPIEQFSIRVAEAWKIGRKGSDDGVILVVAKDDRAVRIEVGYGLEGAIPDAYAKRVVEETIVPRFRAGDFNGGISEGVTTLMKLVEGEKLPEPTRGAQPQGGAGMLQVLAVVLVMLVTVNVVLGNIFGRVLGSALGSGGAGVLVWLVLGSLFGGIAVAVVGFLMSAVLGGSRGNFPGGLGGGGWGGYGGGMRGGMGGGGWGGGGGFGGGGGGFGGGGASGKVVMIARLLRHLFGEDWAVRRAFPAAALERIGALIADEEKRHTGELRFVVEGGLAPLQVLRRQTPRQRAVELFAELGVWDTAANNGVLIYLLLADRDVEIVADRGIAAKVDHAQWEAICRDMEQRFAQVQYEQGVVTGLKEVSDLLARHFPAQGANPNELPDQPMVL